MWVYRPGRSSAKYADVIFNNKIYLFWDGFTEDYSHFKSISEFSDVVKKEKSDATITTISNLSCQLNYFCNQMQIGDYILIPSEHSRFYTIGIITGLYQYKADDNFYFHSRNIEIIQKDIPREVFPQNIQYSLGAFRTIFHAKHAQEILNIINNNYNLKLREDV